MLSEATQKVIGKKESEPSQEVCSHHSTVWAPGPGSAQLLPGTMCAPGQTQPSSYNITMWCPWSGLSSALPWHRVGPWFRHHLVQTQLSSDLALWCINLYKVYESMR